MVVVATTARQGLQSNVTTITVRVRSVTSRIVGVPMESRESPDVTAQYVRLNGAPAEPDRLPPGE